MISVDTNKKELVGEFKNGGQEWQPEGAPEKVQTRDFPTTAIGKAIPYGVYDIARNEGFVGVGATTTLQPCGGHDTAVAGEDPHDRW